MCIYFRPNFCCWEEPFFFKSVWKIYVSVCEVLHPLTCMEAALNVHGNLIIIITFLSLTCRRQVLQSRKDSLREGSSSVAQNRKGSLKDSGSNLCPLVGTSPPRRKDSDRLPSLPPQQDDGYEAVKMPQRPTQQKPVPGIPADNSPSEYFTPPSRPQKPSSPNASPVNSSVHQQPVPPVRPGRSSSSSANAYETVQIFPSKHGDKDSESGDSLSLDKPPRPPKPSQFDDSSSIYQQPRAPVSVITPRDDVYDNVHIKNTPLSSKDAPTSAGKTNKSSTVGIAVGSSDKRNEEAPDGKLEIDSGGMGCRNIESAMEERRQILKEMETKEGVVLLSVQKVKEKTSDHLRETYGMCLLFRNTYTSLHFIFISVILFLQALVCWWSGDLIHQAFYCCLHMTN